MKTSGLLFIAALLVLPNSLGIGATRIWDGGSAGSGNWTADANWQGNVQPAAGDFLIFPPGALRLSNTNTFSPETVFGGIIFQGDNYNIHGNAITLTNHITAEVGASGNVFRPDIRLGAPVCYLRALGTGLQLTFLGGIDVNGRDLTLVCQSGQLVCGGVISGIGDVTKSGSGRAVFSGINGNTYNGWTFVYDGVLELSKYTILNPGNFRVPRIAVPGNLSIGLANSSLISDAVVCEANNQIATSAQVTVAATGELNLNDNFNTIFFLRMAGGHVTSGDGRLTVTGNIVGELDDDGSVISGNLDLGPSGKNVILNNDVRLTIAAVVSSAATAPLHVRGGGEIRLTANNTYAGETVLNSGTLRVSTPGALGTGTNVTLEGGRLVLVNSAISAKQLTVTSPFSDRATIATEGSASAWNGDVALDGFLDVLTAGSSSLTWTGHVSGTGGFLKLGPGLFRLGGTVPNTYAGFSAVDEGVLELAKISSGSDAVAISGTTLDIGDGVGGPGADLVRYAGPGQVADTVNVNIFDSGRLQMQSWSDHVGALYGAGDVDLGTGALIVGGNGFSTTFWGVINGAGRLVKTGATTLTLIGTSTYLNNFTVAQGTLLVHGKLLAGSINSILQVHALGTLGGTGHVDNVTVFPGGKLSPGASAGTLTVSNLWFNNAGRLVLELNGRTPGIDYDRVTAHGAITNYPNGGILDVALGFVPSVGDSFLILDKTSPGPISGAFNGLPQGALLAADAFLFRISYSGGDGNDIVLTRVATPASMLSSLTALTNGNRRLRGIGVSNLVYNIDAATNLITPIPWTFVGTARAGAGGVFSFLDTNAPPFPQRFYRVASP